MPGLYCVICELLLFATLQKQFIQNELVLQLSVHIWTRERTETFWNFNNVASLLYKYVCNTHFLSRSTGKCSVSSLMVFLSGQEVGLKKGYSLFLDTGLFFIGE